MNVSRETKSKLQHYVDLVQRWNRTINLVAPSTLNEIWRRHIYDSSQIVENLEAAPKTWVDIGSGGGFPGIVVAIILAETCADCCCTLVESDQRKATFLQTVLRETETPGRVICTRIEEFAPQVADVVSARALAPLPKLLGYCKRHLAPDGSALLLKGETWEKELKEAQKSWRFDYERATSRTHPNAVILKVRNIVHV